MLSHGCIRGHETKMSHRDMRYRMKKILGTLLAVSTVMGSFPSYVSAEDVLVGVETTKTAQAAETEEKEPQTEKKKTEEASETQTERPVQTESSAQTEDSTQTESSPETEDTSASEKTADPAQSETAGQTEADTKAAESETASETDTEETTETGKETETEAETEKITQSEEAAALLMLKDGNSTTYNGIGVEESAVFVPGTYQVTANLYVPGDLNTVLPGVTAYLTNPNNPLGDVDENGSCASEIPDKPVYNNATLTIAEDGVTKTLTIPVKNPVFTLQQINSGSDVTIKDIVRNKTIYSNTSGSAKREGRITSVTVQLENNSGKYTFTDCVEFPTLLGTEWNVPLSLGVDLSGVAQKDVDNRVYTMTEGAGSSYDRQSGASLLFAADAKSADFQKLVVDDNEVDSSAYTVLAEIQKETYVEVAATFLSTLAAGTHTIRMIFAKGTATAQFTVTGSDSQDNPENEKAGEALAPGTYQITANLYLPGELNTQLPGTTAYLTNPNNPLGIGGHNGIPTDPVADNATLVVGKDGKKTVILDVVNPVFTLQRITAGADISILGAVRDSEIYTGVSQSASRTGRITKLYLELKSNKGLYQFGDCTEFPTLLEVDWNVPLQLSVDFTGARKTSDSTEVKLPDGATTGAGTEATEKQTESETEKKNTKDTDPTAGDGTLKPGTYTVAANIWIDKASSGLPLNPHLTSSVFPPKDPVSNNAKVTIDKNGEATVKVPIVIQSKVMSIKSISGLNIVDSSASGGYLSSITVDLGKVTNPNAVITKSCTVSLDLGELAQTIAKKGREQVWGATFQVNFSGIPSGGSGGGNVDVNSLLAQAENNGQSEQGTNIRIGIRPDDAYSAVYFPLMEEHKNDTEIKESTASGTGISATGSVDTASGQTSVATTEVKNSYLFTIEKLEESEENQDLTEEDRSEALSEQYRKHFTDGTYDLILATPEEAERLYQSEEMKGKFVVLAMNRYEKNADGQSGDAESTDGQTEDAEALVGIDAPDSAASEDGAEIRLLLAAKSFVEKHAVAVTDILSKVKTSAEDAVKEPEKTAVFMVSLGMGTDSAAVQQLLKETKAELLTGTELQEAVDALAEDEDLADLKSEGLCYSTSTVKTTENTKTESEVQTTPETESSETEETEKINITDADSLSAALDAALARKAEDTSDEDGSGADGAGGAVNVSNSSGLDLEAEKAAAESLEPGTYTVSTNLYLPGERNTQLPGTTAYMTNPDNPLGIGGHEGLPIVPAEANGTLVVAEDGTKTVTFDVVNPVFTLQKISAPENSQILAGVRDSERYEGTNGVGVDGRITQLVIQLGDDSAIYPFDDCAEFPTLLETDWYVPLELSVEFTSAEKISDSTEVTIPEDTAGVATN